LFKDRSSAEPARAAALDTVVKSLWRPFWARQALHAAPPSDILAQLIDALYAPLATLLLGATSAFAVGLAVSMRTGELALADCTGLLFIVSLTRICVALAYRRRDVRQPLDAPALLRWEARYAIGCWAFSASLGLLCFFALTQTEDAVSQMLVIAMTTGYTAGVIGRNSSRPRIAVGQLLLALAPIAVGALWRFEFPYFVLAAIAVMYIFAAIDISLFLGRNSLYLLLVTKETGELAHRLSLQNRLFDAALNNMPHGLCMFDSERRLLIANGRLEELYGFAPNALREGMSARDVASLWFAGCEDGAAGAARTVADFEFRLANAEAAIFKVRLGDGRIVAISQTALAGGGAVVISEDITERDRAEVRAHYLASHDSLTGLPNRAEFSRKLQLAIEEVKRSGDRFCVMFIDLDRFKYINDVLGHAAGDLLLRQVAARLQVCVRDGDIVARLGGDEFVVLLADVRNQNEVSAIASRILAAVDQPIIICAQECRVTASIGISTYPIDGRDEQSLTKNADAAMYLAKEDGRSKYRFYSKKIQTQSIERLELETSLRRALEGDEFERFYQAKREVATGEITGAEALLRWRHPRRGVISPGIFIPLAEETGLIVAIGKWVLQTACMQNMAWRKLGLPPMRMAVNLSPRQFNDETLIEDVERALAASGMPADSLELEITESMVIQNVDRALHMLTAIRQLGARIAIDDFGTGYSSMSLLKKMPIDTIKIDQTFVNDIMTDASDRAIVVAIIALAKALDLRIVAEGVETLEQEDFLRKHGCDAIQGFLFSSPVPGDAFADFLAAHNSARISQRNLLKLRTA
jgi:diguanylate cyclase (GGDEF)-like protein